MAVVNKPKSAFRTIAEAADELGVATHVLRFWETKFDQIKPMKRTGGRRYYRPDDLELLKKIKYYLHHKRYTIEGVQKLFKTRGLKAILGEQIQKDFFAPAAADTDYAGESAPGAVVAGVDKAVLAEAIRELGEIRISLSAALAKL